MTGLPEVLMVRPVPAGPSVIRQLQFQVSLPALGSLGESLLPEAITLYSPVSLILGAAVWPVLLPITDPRWVVDFSAFQLFTC